MKLNWFLAGLAAVLFLFATETSRAAVGTNTDLAIGKTASVGVANVGQEFYYQLVVTNLGPLPATSATVVDILPAGVQYLSSAGPGTYNPTNGQWNFTPGNVDAVSILIIQVQATSPGPWVNTATITNSAPADRNPANNTASVNVTVESAAYPIVLTCSSNLTVTATGTNGATVYFTTSASGGCSSPLNLSSTPPSGSTFPIGTTTVYTTASDSCGDSTNCSFTVTVTRQTYPPIVLTCSSNLNVVASGTNGAVVYFTTSASGGCSSPLNLSSTPPSGSTFPIGTTTVYTTASDSCGDSTNCSFTVTVTRQTYPPIVLTCSSNLNVVASGTNGATVYFTTSASGGCSSPLNLSSTPPSGSTFPIGTTTVYTTASDSCGDSTNCSFTVTVTRQTYPPIVLTCSSNLNVVASGTNGATVYFTTSASGGCSSPLNLSSTPPSGSTFPIGTTTVYTTASDSCGDSTNCSFTVTVTRQTYPPIVLTCSSNLNVVASGTNGATVYFTTSASGGCSSPLNLSSTPPSGSTFPIGTTTVYTTASDSCGDSTNCSFTVTVTRQTYPPIVLTCSSNLNVVASGTNGATVYFTTSASGGCSSPLNLSSTPPSGSTFPIGTTTVYTTASDSCGDSTNCSFTVTVTRQTYPPIVLTCSSNLNVVASGTNGATVYFTTSASGGCSSPLNLSSTPPSGSTFPIGTTTVYTTASDSCGDSTNCSFTVTVTRQTYPPIVLTCSSNLNVVASGTNGAVVYFTTSASGGCSSPLNLSSTPPSGSTFPIGTTTVYTTASDSCGDSTNCSFTVTVTRQTYPPIVLTCSSNLNVVASGTNGATVYFTTSASGGCSSPLNLSSTPPSGSTFPIGTTTVYTTASDSCGDSTNCSFTVTVTKQTYPPIVLTCSSNLNVVASGTNGATVYFTTSASGGCSSPLNLSSTPPSGSTFPIGTTTVYTTASDSCGDSTNCSFTVTVTGQTYPPIVLTCSSNLNVTATGTNGATVYFTTSAYGGCSSPLNLSSVPPSGSTFPIGTNTVTTTASDSCGNSTNCTFTVTVTSTNNPTVDLSVTKTVFPTNIVPGDLVHFYVTVTNLGPNNASGVTVSDLLPSGLTLNSAGVSLGTSYNTSSGVWTITNLTVGGVVTLDLGVFGYNAGVFTNTASLTGSTPPDNNPTNNVSSAVLTVAPLQTDLSVTKTVFPTNITVGDLVHFYVTVTNLGPNSASGVTVSDLLPGGLTLNSAGVSLGTSYNTSSGVWTITNLAVGGVVTLDLGVFGYSPGTFTNTASLTGSTPPDSNPTNNTSSAVLTVVPVQTDISVTKTVFPTSVTAGDLVHFYVTVTNLGPNSASGVTVSDVLPGGLTLNSAGVTLGTSYNTASGVWTITNLAVGGVATLDLGVFANNLGSFTNTASLTGSTPPDSNPANNTSSAVLAVTLPPTDLRVTKTVLTNSILVGNNASFLITITNLGPNTASNVVVTDVLPPGLTYRSAGVSGGTSFNESNGVWNINLISVGAGYTLAIGAMATNTGTFTNTATLTSSTPPDSNATNNSASAVVTANLPPPPADLQVTKTVETNSIYVGGYAYFMIAITNVGPTAVSDVVVTDVLPPGLAYDGSVEPAGTSFDQTNGIWTITSLATGAGYAMSITAVATNAGTFTNTATLASSMPADTNAANNSASAVVTATVALPPTDLQVTKTVETNAIYMGDYTYFTITITNIGPNIASNAVVTDVLPPGLESDGFTEPDNTSYNPTNGNWSIPSLAPGAGYALYIITTATNTGIFTNTATLTSSGSPDTNSANNSASAVVTVTPLADLQITKTATITNMTAGTQVVFRLQLQNLGPSSFTNVVVTDLLPAGFKYVTDSTVGGGGVGTYNPVTGQWIVFGYAGTIYNLYITAQATNATFYTNTATVAVPAGYADPNLLNNTSSVAGLIYYTLSGYVFGCQTNGPAIPFTTVTLSGAASGATLTDTNGFYIFSNLLAGAYTVTPVQPGNTFAPAATMTNLSTNTVLQVFQGGIPQVRGKITYGTNGPGLPGIYLQLTGGPMLRTVVTDTNGVYSFTNTVAGKYTVTPLATNGFVLTPTNAVVVISATNCVGVASFVSGPRTVQLAALEVIQVIQNWSNSIVLIQNKETWVRAYLQLPAATNPPVLIQGARLVGPGGAMEPPFNEGGTFLVQTTNASAGRLVFTNSLDFKLPADWPAGTVKLQFVATNFLTVIATNPVPTNCTVQVTFVPSRPLPLRIYPVNWKRASDDTLQSNSKDNLDDLPRRLLSMYPVPSVASSVAEPILAPFTKQPVQKDYKNLNKQLAAKRALFKIYGVNIEYRIYHGAVARGGPAWPATGEADLPGWISSGLMPPNDDFYTAPEMRHLASHEIGHNLNLQHDVSGPGFGYGYSEKIDGDWVTMNTAMFTAKSEYAKGVCGEQGATNYVYPWFQPMPAPAGAIQPAMGPTTNGVTALVDGLDTLTRANAPEYNPIADPNADFDIMAYCEHAPLQNWISASTYPAMLKYITNNFAPAAPARPAPGPAEQFRFIRGPLDYSDNTGSFLPSYDVTLTNGYVPPAPVPGNYSLRLFDTLGNLLDEIPFAPDNDADESLNEDDNQDEDNSPPETGSFIIPVPISNYAVPIAQVQLWENGDQMLAQESTAVNQPEFTSGLAVTQSSNEVDLAWGAVNATAYAVQYSADGGATWDTLAVDVTNSVDDIDTDYLGASSQGMFRVIATDGFDSTNEVSMTPVTIPNHPPSLVLSEPLDGATYIADQQIILNAVANDPQDGLLDGTNVVWTSSLNGFLDYGADVEIQASTLSVGTHVITVTATDNEGLTSSASVTIHVLADFPPTLSIATEGSQVLLSWPSSVTNYVLESTASLLPANWIEVTTAPIAADITQTVTVDLTNTNQFFRLRMP